MNLIQRLASYYRRHGFRSTGARVMTALHRLAYLGRMVLFSCPLPASAHPMDGSIQIETSDGTNLPSEDYAHLLGEGNPTSQAKLIAERFAAGSEVWLAKVEGRLAGFGWTVVGRTIEPHYFELKPDEAHLYDFFVLPEFRGRRINVMLVTHILTVLGSRSIRQAHIECAAWNRAQIHSLSKTAFRRYAEVTKITVQGRTTVIWHQGRKADQGIAH
jgi:ribosomal protein S18 acetylase RimI-like enzyme